MSDGNELREGLFSVRDHRCVGSRQILPVDLYKSEVKKFRIEGDNIRCPFISLPGLGESAAIPSPEARMDGPFLSIEDLQVRGRAGSAVIEALRSQGALEGLSETNQISMF